MRWLEVLLLGTSLLAAACGDTTSTTPTRAECNGVLDDREETVDDLWDRDGDGFFDAASPECQATYGAAQLDCRDNNAEVNPGMDEVACNDLDDDCDAETLDAVDEDGDGYTACDGDCNDLDPAIAPGFAEVECDGLDNDCDGSTADARDNDADGWSHCDDCVDTDPDVNPGQTEVACDNTDNDCDPATLDGEDVDGDGSLDCFDCDDSNPDLFPGNPEICEDGLDQDCDGNDVDCAVQNWAGTWATSPPVNYNCGGGNVVVNFSSIAVIDENPAMTFVIVGGLHPGSMTGAVDAAGNFSASASASGGCTRNFMLSGTFHSLTSFTATLTAQVSSCSGCADQSWTITGTK